MIDKFNYWNWEDKERAKLKKRDAGSVQSGTPFGYLIITRAVELDLGLVYIYGKQRYRPKTFMKSPRFKSVIFEFKW